jgi:hypothetical protein
MNKKGVTLVEIIFTIVLVLIVSSFSFASYRIWQKRVSLNNTTQEMSSGLMRAQQLATAAANNTDWGVHLEVDRYVIFSGTFYNEIDPDNIIKDLGGIEIQNPNDSFTDGSGGRIPDVLFYKFSGQTANTGTIHLIAPLESSDGKTIEVKSSGQID